MRDFSKDHSMLALNTASLGHNLPGYGAGWSTEQVIEACAERGFGAISFWRQEIDAKQAVQIGNKVRAAGMQVCGLCRSPFLTGPLALPTQQAILDDMYRAIDMAQALGTDVLTIVTGGVIEGSHSITESLQRVSELVSLSLPRARQAGVKLTLRTTEPSICWQPLLFGDTVRDAIDICEAIDDPFVAIAIDVYHVWWDTDLANQLQRAGRKRIAAYHLCDWLADTNDILLDRGMMGEGVANLKAIRQAVEAAGYQGFCEVEIFSANNWWKRNPAEVLDVMLERFRTVC